MNAISLQNPISKSKEHLTTVNKLKETYRVASEIIENLDDYAIGELYGGSDGDIDGLFNNIVEETYNVLYGGAGLVKESDFYYLDKLTKSIEETMRIENLNYFILSCIPNFEMNWHHIEWGQLLMRYPKLCIEAARDHGKSYLFSNAFPIWNMYRYRGVNDFKDNPRKDLTILERGFIVTNEMELAIDLMEIVKNTIEDNDDLARKLYPDKKDNWSKQSIKCKNGARLNLKSYGGSFRGRHPGYIIVDDFLKDNVIYSEIQRKKAIEYFHSVIMNAIVPKGHVKVVGTPFHASDLYGDLKTKKGWKVFEYPAIFPDGKILWRNRYSFKDLMEKKETQGNLIFSRENLVRPIVSDSSIFPYELVCRSFVGMQEICLVKNRESYPKKFNRIVTGCDFAMSSSVGADYSVFMTWGITENEEMYLMHIYREKGKSYAEQMGILKTINTNFRPDVIYAENNQFQRIFIEGMDNSGMPVYPHTTGTNKYDLKFGLPGLSILFEKNKIKFPRGDEYSRNMTDLIISEFTSVTWTDKGLEGVGNHDDCCMSTWIGSCAMKHSMGSVGFGFLD